MKLPEYYKITIDDFLLLKSKDNVPIICQECFHNFNTKKSNILSKKKEYNSFIRFCSSSCSVKNRVKDNKVKLNCSQCEKEIIKTKLQASKSKNHFCSRSCSASFNNKKFVKRTLIRTCVECNSLVKSYRHTRCEKHHENYINNKYINKTIGEYRNKSSLKDKHSSWINSHIRLFAREWNKDLKQLPCAKCGYNKHVELAHIKKITSYPDNSKLSEVNNKENIIQLCPNCHWEFDNLDREVFKDLLISLNKNYCEY